MSRYRYSSDEESDLDVRIKHRHASPARPAIAHYVDPRAPRPRYYERGPVEDRFLVPSTERTIVTTRRSRSRDRRSPSPGASAPPPPPAGPVIINNRIYNHSDSESLSDSDSDRDSKSRSRSHRRHRAHSRASSGYSRELEREHERDRDRLALEHVKRDYEKEIEAKRREYEKEVQNKRREYELENTRNELKELKLAAQVEQEEKRRNRTMQEERELREAKKELDAIRKAKETAEYERRIKEKLELERMKKEEAALEEKKRRDKEARDAIEKYKKEEAERRAKEKAEAEAKDREYKAKMQEQLLKSGLDEKEINAILAGKNLEKLRKEKEEAEAKVKWELEAQAQVEVAQQDRPVYTRMARRHLSIETLRAYNIDFQLDPVSRRHQAPLKTHISNFVHQDPDYILIKRWVPETEQDVLWRHTKIIREKRSSSSGKLVSKYLPNTPFFS